MICIKKHQLKLPVQFRIKNEKKEQMKRVEFSTEINAPAEKVWKALWEDANYRNWTSAFCEGSYMTTNWEEGGKVHFLSPSGAGMYSVISKNEENSKMYFTHIGEIVNFEEQSIDEKTAGWSGACENYSLFENNGVTRLVVEIDLTDESLDYFEKAFPKGLELVKLIAEK